MCMGHPVGAGTGQAVTWGYRNVVAQGAERDVVSKRLPPERSQQCPSGTKAAGEGEQVLPGRC